MPAHLLRQMNNAQLRALAWAQLRHPMPVEAAATATFVRRPRGWPFDVEEVRDNNRGGRQVTIVCRAGGAEQTSRFRLRRVMVRYVNHCISFLLNPDSEHEEHAFRGVVEEVFHDSGWARYLLDRALSDSGIGFPHLTFLPEGTTPEVEAAQELSEALDTTAANLRAGREALAEGGVDLPELTPEEARERLRAVAEATRPDQLSLIPNDRPVGTLGSVFTRAVRFLARPITQQFLDSVHHFGILQPVVLVRRPADQGYQLVAGRRRMTAATRLGMESVPAMVFPPGTSATLAASVALMENNQRSPNPVSDLRAIQLLMREGASVRQIQDELGISLATLNMRLRLAALSPAFITMLADGNINHSLALALARLPRAEQDELLRAGDPITINRVEVARRLGGRVVENVPMFEGAVEVSIAPERREGRAGYSVRTRYEDHEASTWTPRLRLSGVRISPLPDAPTPAEILAPPPVPVVAMGHRAARGAVTGRSDDRELTPEQVQQVAEEMNRTPASAGDDTWTRVRHLLELASLCVPALPDERHEAVYLHIQESVEMVVERENAPAEQGQAQEPTPTRTRRPSLRQSVRHG